MLPGACTGVVRDATAEGYGSHRCLRLAQTRLHQTFRVGRSTPDHQADPKAVCKDCLTGVPEPPWVKDPLVRVTCQYIDTSPRFYT